MPAELTLKESQRLYGRAQRLIPGISQTNSKRPPTFAPADYPAYAAYGKGSHVWDVDGNEYIDWILGLGPISLGYRYPTVDRAIRRQLERGIIYGLLDPLEVSVAAKLVELVPCAESVRFLKGGGKRRPQRRGSRALLRAAISFSATDTTAGRTSGRPREAMAECHPW